MCVILMLFSIETTDLGDLMFFHFSWFNLSKIWARPKDRRERESENGPISISMWCRCTTIANPDVAQLITFIAFYCPHTMDYGLHISIFISPFSLYQIFSFTFFAKQIGASSFCEHWKFPHFCLKCNVRTPSII